MFGLFKREPIAPKVVPLDPGRQRFLNRWIGAVRGVGLHAVGTPQFSMRVSLNSRIGPELPVDPYWTEYAQSRDMRIFNREDARDSCQSI